MKVCVNCAYWTDQLKGLCRLTKVGCGQFASCKNWEKASSAQDKKPPPAWKDLPN